MKNKEIESQVLKATQYIYECLNFYTNEYKESKCDNAIKEILYLKHLLSAQEKQA